MVTEDCAEAAETTARAARAHVLTVEKTAPFRELAEGTLAAQGQTGLYRLNCTNESRSTWVLYGATVSVGLSFKGMVSKNPHLCK